MKRGLLALAVALMLADAFVVVVRARHQVPAHISVDPSASFNDAIRRHDYRRAYELTDLPLLKISGASSAVTLPNFAAFANAHPLGRLSVEQGLVHIPTTDLRVTATTGPLPSLALDGIGIRLLSQRVKTGAVAAWRYTYVIVTISGPHALTIGPGPVTAGRSLSGVFRGDKASVDVSLALSSDGDRSHAPARVTRAWLPHAPVTVPNTSWMPGGSARRRSSGASSSGIALSLPCPRTAGRSRSHSSIKDSHLA